MNPKEILMMGELLGIMSPDLYAPQIRKRTISKKYNLSRKDWLKRKAKLRMQKRSRQINRS